MVANNFSPTHQARESQPSVFDSITSPTARIFLLYTNKPITATDINWIPFLKLLPQPLFFCPSLLNSNQPAHQVDFLHSQAHIHTCTRVCICTHLGIRCLTPFATFLFFGPAWFCLSIPFISYHVEYKLRITLTCFCFFF